MVLLLEGLELGLEIGFGLLFLELEILGEGFHGFVHLLLLLPEIVHVLLLQF